MATVHPSRLALIPQDMRTANSERSRDRTPSPKRNGGRDYNRGRDDRATGSGHDHDRRGRSDSRERSSGNRRASPQYDDYRRAPPPAAESSAPWRAQENMYPPRQQQRYGGGGGGTDFMENRRLQREHQVVNVWPPSPKEPARALSPKRKKSGKSSKRYRDSDLSSSSDSEEERRRKERKERKRARRNRGKEDRPEKDKKHRRRSRSRRRDDSSDDEDRRKHRSKRSRTKSRSPARATSRSPSRARSESPDRMDIDTKAVELPTQQRGLSTGPPPSSRDDDSGGEEVGPVPVDAPKSGKKFDERAYGGALLRGEGSAMAAFLQDGTDLRIPRRGEIGLSSDQIASCEDVGYVMSGSRHRRMNAVRMRKENQVISAEEKRGILKLQREERERREAILREEFSELVQERLKASSSGPGTNTTSQK
ncbi:ras-induced vulval development antagonist-domain-containing protein [Crepidotus variabilis]|uniref:Ras-induced vulval development antagonist-domain-containing protein n=1 Tax=Crepidotus variabilis TaxID=179855 RepID=A0A9P6JN72_9AGAR|nr:ras-induced vulval development antagonist-domain-containing protein [Crepidotus variabilis]